MQLLENATLDQKFVAKFLKRGTTKHMEEQKIEVKESDMVIDHDDFEMVTADESKLSPH